MNATLDLPSAVSETEEPISVERYLMLQDGRWELVHGKVQEAGMGARSARITSEILALLVTHVRTHRLGIVFNSDAQYRCFPDDPRHIRLPDLSFVASGRFPEDREPDGLIEIAPNLAVEIVSPNDGAEEIEARRCDFLSVGTEQFWIVYPKAKTVHVYRSDGSCRVFREKDTLDVGPLFPEFRPLVADFFP